MGVELAGALLVGFLRRTIGLLVHFTCTKTESEGLMKIWPSRENTSDCGGLSWNTKPACKQIALTYRTPHQALRESRLCGIANVFVPTWSGL